MTLASDAAHYRRMAAADHKPECQASRSQKRYGLEWIEHPNPACPGCNPQSDRDLFARLADEIDAHLAPTEPDLFGGESVEPDPASPQREDTPA